MKGYIYIYIDRQKYRQKDRQIDKKDRKIDRQKDKQIERQIKREQKQFESHINFCSNVFNPHQKTMVDDPR